MCRVSKNRYPRSIGIKISLDSFQLFTLNPFCSPDLYQYQYNFCYPSFTNLISVVGGQQWEEVIIKDWADTDRGKNGWSRGASGCEWNDSEWNAPEFLRSPCTADFLFVQRELRDTVDSVDSWHGTSPRIVTCVSASRSWEPFHPPELESNYHGSLIPFLEETGINNKQNWRTANDWSRYHVYIISPWNSLALAYANMTKRNGFHG